jgi:hypothetical protein
MMIINNVSLYRRSRPFRYIVEPAHLEKDGSELLFLSELTIGISKLN